MGTEELKSSFHQPLIPLSFQSIEEEINFWSIVDLINFGSGYRHLLHKHCKRGAFQVICAGVMSMYIGGSGLSATYMKNLSLSEVSELFQLPFIEEEKLNDYMSIPKPGPLKPLISMLHTHSSYCYLLGSHRIWIYP